jgi:hypothetical protein
MSEIKEIVKDTVQKVDTVKTDREKLDAVNDAISKIKTEINATQEDITKWAESLRIILEKLSDWAWNKADWWQLDWFTDIDMSSLNDDIIIGINNAQNNFYLDAIHLRREIRFLRQHNQDPEAFLLYEKWLNDTQWRQYRENYIKELKELPEKVISAYPNPTSGEINIGIDYSIVWAGLNDFFNVIRPLKPWEWSAIGSIKVVDIGTTINPLFGLPIIEQSWYTNNTEHVMWDYKNWSTSFNREYDQQRHLEWKNIVVEWSINIVSMDWRPVVSPAQFKIDQDSDHKYTFDLSHLPAWVYIIKIPEIQVFGKPLMKKIVKQ